MRNDYNISNLSESDAMRIRRNPAVRIKSVGARYHRADPYAYEIETDLDVAGVSDLVLSLDHPAAVIVKRR